MGRAAQLPRLGVSILLIGALSLLTIQLGSWSSFVLPVQAHHEAGHPPEVSAQAAALIDVESGRIVYSKNGDEPMLIASLTKIMTAIVALETGNLADRVEAGRNAVGKEGSSIYLQLEEEMNLENLLYGLMLRSGNDAAMAIAEHVGGSVEGFVYLMNQKAEELGLMNTQFRNPHGLDEEGHYASANDLARLTAYALKNPQFQEIVKTKTKNAPNPYASWDYRWHNKNKMLRLYEGADGVKTGYTKQAGRCLVSSATRNGQQFAVVTIRASNDWADHTRLLDYGFAYYPQQLLVAKGANLGGTTLVSETSFHYPLSEAEHKLLKLELTELEPGMLDYQLGIRGHLHILLDQRSIGLLHMVEPESPRLDHDRTTFRFTPPPEQEKLLTSVANQVVRLLKMIFSI